MILRPLLTLSIAAFALVAFEAPGQGQAPGQAPAPAPATTPAPAQTPAPAAAPAAPASPVAIPPHNCVKPEFPGRLASTSRINTFNKEVSEYGDCIRNYVNEVKAIANAATAAGNSAIDEYNAYSNDLKAKIEAAKD